MPIKITKGNQIYPGRVTTPKGTFLGDPILPPKTPNPFQAPQVPGLLNGVANQTLFGNPGGSIDGVFGGSQGMNVPQGGTSKFIDYLKKVFALPTPAQTSATFGPNGSALINATNQMLSSQQGSPTSAFGATPPKINSSTSPYVGKDLITSPNEIAGRQLQQLFPNMSAADIAKTMALKGYERHYQMGVGEVWVKVAESAPTKSLQNTPGTRPDYVDAASLERGERVTSASGISFVGGANYTNEAGETVAQYAMTIPGGPRAGQDKHGDYKWVSTTQQDSDGNWVRIYRQQLRKVKTRSGLRRIAAGQEAQAEQNPAVTGNAQYTQLVTLRADYG